MFTELVAVNGIDDESGEPVRLATTRGHRLLREFSEGAAMFLGGFGRHSQRAFRLGVVRRQQNPAVRLDGQDPVPGLKPEAVGHILRQRGADGPARLSQGHFLGHASRVAQ